MFKDSLSISISLENNTGPSSAPTISNDLSFEKELDLNDIGITDTPATTSFGNSN